MSAGDGRKPENLEETLTHIEHGQNVHKDNKPGSGLNMSQIYDCSATVPAVQPSSDNINIYIYTIW